MREGWVAAEAAKIMKYTFTTVAKKAVLFMHEAFY